MTTSTALNCLHTRSSLSIRNVRSPLFQYLVRSLTSLRRSGKYIWCNVIWSADGGVSHDTSGFAPVVDDGPVADSQVNLVQVDRHATAGLVCWLFWLLKKLPVIGVIVQLVEAGRQTEISELQVASTVKLDNVWLDITASGKLQTRGKRTTLNDER